MNILNNNTIFSKSLNYIWSILFNKKYFKGSLYGLGIFPFWIYVKYFGKPTYILSRKLGLNKFFSLMVANLLGSAFHVKLFIDAKPTTFVWFVISLVIFTSIFYFNHNVYLKSRLNIQKNKINQYERS